MCQLLIKYGPHVMVESSITTTGRTKLFRLVPWNRRPTQVFLYRITALLSSTAIFLQKCPTIVLSLRLDMAILRLKKLPLFWLLLVIQNLEKEVGRIFEN